MLNNFKYHRVMPSPPPPPSSPIKPSSNIHQTISSLFTFILIISYKLVLLFPRSSLGFITPQSCKKAASKSSIFLYIVKKVVGELWRRKHIVHLYCISVTRMYYLFYKHFRPHGPCFWFFDNYNSERDLNPI